MVDRMPRAFGPFPAPRAHPGLQSWVGERLSQGDERIVVTGAGGWLGLATLELLEAALGESFSRRVFCYGSRERPLELRSGRRFHQLPLKRLSELGAAPSWLFHYAFLTREHAEAMDEVAYCAMCGSIITQVIDALPALGCERVILASSGAARLVDDVEAAAALRLYGAMKVQEENAFARWAEEVPSVNGVGSRRLVIARIHSLSGPYINKPDRYAIAALIGDALAGRPVLVRSPHLVIRSYVAIREMLSLALAILVDHSGAPVSRFDTGGEPRELESVARTVAGAWPGGSHLRAPVTDPRVDRYHGDGDAYRRLLARYGIDHVPLAEQVIETADWLSRHGYAGRQMREDAAP